MEPSRTLSPMNVCRSLCDKGGEPVVRRTNYTVYLRGAISDNRASGKSRKRKRTQVAAVRDACFQNGRRRKS